MRNPHNPNRLMIEAPALDFNALVEAIRRVDEHSAGIAKRAVNVSLTLRNWVFGLHLAEYELSGANPSTS